MDKFRAPYRIITVFDRLKSRGELSHCDITIEEYPADREDEYFPSLQFDTARVFVRYKDFSVNIVGRLDSGSFSYWLNAYSEESPWGDQLRGVTIENVERVIDFAVSKFQSVPKD